MRHRLALLTAPALAALFFAAGCNDEGGAAATPTPSATAGTETPAAPDAVTTPEGRRGKAAEAGGTNMPSMKMVD